jgi:polar amino acid transport system substrate-binding protein
MNMLRRRLLCAVLPIVSILAGCAATAPAPDAATLAALAPTGTLRVGVYPGSPSSLVTLGKSGDKAGVAHDLGIALGERLGVPVRLVEFARIAQVIDALKSGAVDFTFTNASESRARDVDFTPTLLRLELGYLVLPDSPIKTLADVDRHSMRVGVSQGSTSQGVLSRQFKNATLLPAASLTQAQGMLRQHAIDAFATNKGILFELSDALPNSRVLDGSWGYEALAIGIPKGRQAGLPYLLRFGQDMTASGQLQSMVQRAGLRGTAASQ